MTACERLQVAGERLASGWRAAGEQAAAGKRLAGKQLATGYLAAGEIWQEAGTWQMMASQQLASGW